MFEEFKEFKESMWRAGSNCEAKGHHGEGRLVERVPKKDSLELLVLLELLELLELLCILNS
jgi:hypothetical protein